MKEQKKKGKIDDEVTIDTPPEPDSSESDTPYDYDQDYGSNNSYLPYHW